MKELASRYCVRCGEKARRALLEPTIAGLDSWLLVGFVVYCMILYIPNWRDEWTDVPLTYGTDWQA